MQQIKQKPFHKGHHIVFRFAWEGIVYAFNSQPNLKVHFSLALIAIFFGFIFQISLTEWATLVLVIFLVIVAEMFNTAMEEAVNTASKEWSQEAKHAKDATAGAVLFAAIGSVIIGLVIFLPHLLKLLGF